MFGSILGFIFGSCSAPHFDIFFDGLSKSLGMNLGAIFELLGLVLGGCRTQQTGKLSVFQCFFIRMFFGIEADLVPLFGAILAHLGPLGPQHGFQISLNCNPK